VSLLQHLFPTAYSSSEDEEQTRQRVIYAQETDENNKMKRNWETNKVKSTNNGNNEYRYISIGIENQNSEIAISKKP